MFKQLQIKLTITYTLILIAILLATNGSVYFLMVEYNAYQMASEVSNMLKGIKSTEWYEPQSDDSSLENLVASKTDDESDDSSEDSEVNKTDENKPEENKTEEIKTEDHKIEDDKSEEQQTQLTKTEEVEQEEQTKVPELTTSPAEGNEITEEELSVLTIEELQIPAAVVDFDYYMIFNPQNQRVKGLALDTSLRRTLTEQGLALDSGAQPRVIEVDKGKEIYYLLAKMPVQIKQKTFGYYVVGKDISVAYTTLDNLLKILVLSTIAGVLISVLLGYILAGRSIKPVRAAYEAKQAFAANASHELRTPLSVVMLSADALSNEIQEDSVFQKQLANDIKEEAVRLQSLVNQLLFLARSDEQKTNLAMARIDFSSLCQNLSDMIKPLANQKEITLVTDIPDKLYALGDQKLLESVVTVIIDNAIKYTPNRGEVAISLKSLKTPRGYKRFGRHALCLKVTDTGSGISPEAIKHIFDRFYREDVSRSRDTGGFGLGLSIAQQIVNLHHGNITVESAFGSGTTFTVWLPQSDTPYHDTNHQDS